MALILVILQTLMLVAGLALLGQAIVGVFNWRDRQQNVVYQIFGIVAGPIVKVVRRITPPVVLDRHIPIAAFALLVVGYFAIVLVLRDVCLSDLSQRGCERLAELRAAAAKAAQ